MYRCQLHAVCARCLCTSDLFDGFSVLQPSTQHNMARSNLAKPLDVDRTIAIAVGHQEAYGVYDRVPVGRAKRLTLRRGVEDPGDREDEDDSLVLTWSPRRLSELGRRSTGGRIERVSTPNLIRLCHPLLPRRCQPHHQLRFMPESLRHSFAALVQATPGSPREGVDIHVGAMGALRWALDLPRPRWSHRNQRRRVSLCRSGQASCATTVIGIDAVGGFIHSPDGESCVAKKQRSD
jgi:hypothetical protein